MSQPSEIDIDVTMALEGALRDALVNTMTTLKAVGAHYDERHIMSAVMTLFISTLASLTKPESWATVLEDIRDNPGIQEQMREIAGRHGNAPLDVTVPPSGEALN